VEEDCKKIDIQLIAKKTKVIALNSNDSVVKTRNQETGGRLGGNITSTKQGITIRKALTWNVLHEMKRVWKSHRSDVFKRRFVVIL
jgi:hypothetical protein